MATGRASPTPTTNSLTKHTKNRRSPNLGRPMRAAALRIQMPYNTAASRELSCTQSELSGVGASANNIATDLKLRGTLISCLERVRPTGDGHPCSCETEDAVHRRLP